MEHTPAQRLGMLRRGLGLTQGEFADEFGIDWIRVKNIELGRTALGIADLQKICAPMPAVLGFLVMESDVYIEDLKASDHSKSKLLLSLFQDGRLAEEAYLNSRFKYRNGNQES